MFIVIAFSISWLPISLVHGLNYKGFHLHQMESFKNVKDTQAAVLLGGPSGLFVFIARMTQTGVFKKIIFSMFCIKKKF